MKIHHYKTLVSYERAFEIAVSGKAHNILGSSDPSFLGDATKYNPEELFLAAIASCHMLWYLHLCATHNITVTDYKDNASGVMEENKLGSGAFTSVTLQPQVGITATSMLDKAQSLHKEANAMCFIANSCNFKLFINPVSILLRSKLPRCKHTKHFMELIFDFDATLEKYTFWWCQ